MLTKKIWFDENSQPPKNMIWYKGVGKFYEYKNGEWVVAYDLNNTLAQQEQDELLTVLKERYPDFEVNDKNTLTNVIEKILDDINYINNKINNIENYLGITLEPEIDEKYYQYFTIEATEDETTIYFRQSAHAYNDSLDALKVEVSTDDGETWEEVTAAPASGYDVPGAILAELDARDKVLIRGKNEAYGYCPMGTVFDNCNFYSYKPCYIYGNIMSLIGGDDFARLRKVKEYAFAYFFSDWDEELNWSWVLSKEGEELLLPATMLAGYCYSSMFTGCVGLTTAPKLPATTLAEKCYGGMFIACMSLTSAPELPATTLVDNCYSGMFWGCTGLTVAPELSATTLANSCYENMFAGCTNLTSVPELPATTLMDACYKEMFSGCSNLTTAPELPATTLARSCYCYMFGNCTSLTSAPELPATTLVDYCYEGMFNMCTSLNYIRAMFTTTPSDTYTTDWVGDVAASGTFVKNHAATWDVTGNDGIPSGWTVETADA